MQAFVNNGFRGVDLNNLNYVHKDLRALTLEDIATVDGKRIFHFSYLGTKGNGLQNNEWPQVPSTLLAFFLLI